MNNYCIAYTEGGQVCRRPADYLDVRRGGMVCDEHRPADLILKNKYGRYEFDGHELTSGTPLEVLRGDRWERGCVEFDWDREDYVILLALGGTMTMRPDLSVRLQCEEALERR